MKKYADALERIVWTLAEAAGAGGLVKAWQSLPVADIPDGWVPAVALLLTVVLATIKNVIASNVGNGSASTLPANLEPIPAEAIQGELAPGVGMPLDADGDGRNDTNGQFVKRS